MRWSWGILGLIAGSIMGDDLGDGSKAEIIALRIGLALGLGCLGFWLGLRRERALAAAGVVVQGPAVSQVLGGLLGGVGGGLLGGFIAAQLITPAGVGYGNVVNQVSRGCSGCVSGLFTIGLAGLLGTIVGLLLGVWLGTLWSRRKASDGPARDPQSRS